jgi:hypothetical protein
MTRVEKADYRRVVDARKAVGNPVLATEHDLIVDYVSCRSRIAALRQLAKSAIDRSLKRDRWGQRQCIPPDQRHAAGMIRQIDATSSVARRLAKDLNLIGSTAAKDVNDD